MLIVGAIAYMIINKDIRVSQMKYFRKSSGFFRIAFNKIAVEIKILGIATKTFFHRAILINAIIDAPVQATANIINRNDSQNNIIRYSIFISYNIPYHQHTCIYAIRFARMNAIVYKYNSFIILSDV